MSLITRLLLGISLCLPFGAHAQKKGRPNLQLEMNVPTPAAQLPDAFPQVIGTQIIGPVYKFDGKKDAVLEGAEGIIEMGSRILKINAISGQQLTPFIAMPFTHYVLWYRSNSDWVQGFTPEMRRREYNAVYAFTRDLLSRFDTAGKTFFIGHWEGDWYLLPGYNTAVDVPAAASAAMIEWLNTRQQAVDDARSECPFTKCRVFTYAEVNRVRDAMKDGKKRMVNTVLPKVNVDFVSYSAYDVQMRSTEDIRATLDYINAQIPLKAGLPAKRVFIGECGLSWQACGGDGAVHEQKNREILAKFLNWRPAMVLFWQYYNNEVVDGKQVGFWLVDNKQNKTPLHATLTGLFVAQEAAAQEMKARQRRLPSFDEMAGFSESWLAPKAK